MWFATCPSRGVGRAGCGQQGARCLRPRVHQGRSAAEAASGPPVWLGRVVSREPTLEDAYIAIVEVLPLTHAITGSRLAADGGSLASVLPSLGLEAGLGVCYLLAAVVLLHWFERGSRLKGTLDTL